MSVKQKNLLSSRSEYTLAYSSMGGVDLSGGAGKSRKRFSRLENMYKDYEESADGITESVPGFRKILSLGKHINAIFSHHGRDGEEFLVVHAGEDIYRFPISERDSIGTLTPICSIRDVRSDAFTSGSEIFIIDGENLTRIDANGNAEVINSYFTSAYVPTTFVNGTELEQRNLLSDYTLEKYTVTNAEELAYGTPELMFRITSPTKKTCAVTGIDGRNISEVFIPAYTELLGERYAVTEICDGAFADDYDIESLCLSSKTERIGAGAFAGCDALARVICSDMTSEIGEGAFENCTSLSFFHAGAALALIGAGAFSGCSALSSFNYSLDEAHLELIDGADEISSLTKVYGSVSRELTVSIPIFGLATHVQSVNVNGASLPFAATSDAQGYFHSFRITTQYGAAALNGAEVTVRLCFEPENLFGGAEYALFKSPDGATVSDEAAIKGCRICESYDGRIFLSGNPSLPNTVFYSSRGMSGRNEPTYFGALNYFNDGTGAFTVTSLLTAGDSLAVFKSGDDGGGSIFYHTPKETDMDILPKIYPVSYTHSGICARGDSISFFDDPIFISPLGVSALEKKNINLARSVAVRSHNINPSLLTESAKDITLAEWQGYLAVAVNGTVYLADSRDMFTHPTGNTEYEWYILKGVGTYQNDTRVYRYASTPYPGTRLHERIDEPTDETVYSYDYSPDLTVYYTFEGGVMYAVTPTEQMSGGTFSPAVYIHGCGDGKYLFFGTECGDICLFNNDKRGEPPVYSSESLSNEEKRERYGRRIHTSYYSFAGHAPKYALSTVRDDCGIPHLTKSTVKHSLAVKLRTFGHGRIVCEVGTDRSGYSETAEIPNSEMKFDDLDFSSMTFSEGSDVTLPISEKEKKWVEKDIGFYADDFASPFGISSIAYRFTVKGRIKKQ